MSSRRIQGGTAGIIAAIFAGRLDPFDGKLPEDRFYSYSDSDWRKRVRRERAKLRRDDRAGTLAQRSPF